jgi:prepilin-type N-terminal cleavage/methylation domain-containing protein
MIRSRKNAGFTLIELMIVVAIIAIIASIAIPKLMSARLAANEAAAISTLRSISSAQAQVQSSGSIDTDADGAGEYGYFAELAGAFPMRTSAGGLPAAGGAPDILNPSILPSAFGTVAGSLVQRSGYYFQMWLPDAAFAGVAEDPTGGKAAAPWPDSNNGEIMWACYAWPVDLNSTGNRCFFVNQEGDLMQCQNRQAVQFTGDGVVTGVAPTFDEIYNVAGDMSSGLRVGTAGGPQNTIWTPVQ